MRRESSRSRKPSVLPPSPVSPGQAFKRYFVTGLATLFPVAVTLWLVVKIFTAADGILGQYFKVRVPGLGLVVTVIVILLVGVLSVHFFGRVLFLAIEGWLGRLPFVRKIYPVVKQLGQFFFTEEGGRSAFRGVVLTEFPRAGVYSIAFVTNESTTTVTGTPTTLLTLLIPTPPSPLTGPIIFVPAEDVVWLTMSVEDAFKLVMSAGVATSPLQVAVH